MHKSLVAFLVSVAFVPAAHAQDIAATLEAGIGKSTLSAPVEIALADGDRGGRGGRDWSGGNRGGGGDNGGGWRGRGGGQTSAQPAPSPAPPPVPQARSNGGNEGWRSRSGGEVRSQRIEGRHESRMADGVMGRQQRGWNRGGNNSGQAVPTPVPQQRGDWNRNRSNGTDWDRNNNGRVDRRWDRNNNGRVDRNWDRNRDGDLDRRHDRNNDGRVDHGRNGRDDRRWSNNGNSNHHGNNGWNRSWRDDRRYDWRSHRNQYRSYYQAPRYYNPYGYSYGYQRFSIGIYLDNLFFSNRYWINDPWQYRLPSPGYGMRWVRYYDDVLLVDMESGYVVDVIHDFFW